MDSHRKQRSIRIRHRRPECSRGGCPIAAGSRFRFDSNGCIYNWVAVFGAYISGELNESEMRAVDDHQATCLKCHNALCAHLGAFEDRMMADSGSNCSENVDAQPTAEEESSGQDDAEDDFAATSSHNPSTCTCIRRSVKKNSWSRRRRCTRCL